jgi:hypothetical protein
MICSRSRSSVTLASNFLKRSIFSYPVIGGDEIQGARHPREILADPSEHVFPREDPEPVELRQNDRRIW